jgi:L-threonylcarbamoyladenylate synthase
MPVAAPEYAARLFDALRRLDAAGVSRIVVEEPPQGPAWDAIRDRLRRAATPKDTEENTR